MFWYSIIKTSDLKKLEYITKLAKLKTTYKKPKDRIISIYEYLYPEVIMEWEIWHDYNFRYLEKKLKH